ncbi:uncharacterized protein LOC135207219 [Macrobrachium nipponense]|uniref:uncharacterized protein LOC135207219 n=1 Tax=Macrobrachium nipponense TaxID=159736 RepID=UPI0030C7A311
MSQITGDPIIKTLDGPSDGFHLLTYLEDFNDHSLMDRLGIGVPVDGDAPVQTMAENNSKLLDLNASQYATLQAGTPRPDRANNAAQTGYYTIDIDELPGCQGNAEVSDPLAIDSAGSFAMDSYDETFVQSNATDKTTRIVLHTSDNIAGESNDPLGLNTSSSTEQKIILAQEKPNQYFIITGDHCQVPINLLETHTTLPLVSLVSPSPVVNTIALEAAPGNDGVPYSDNQPNTFGTVTPPGKSSQPKPRASRRQRPKKPKKYEMTQELHDPAEEKKRLNAINAKRNRDRKKDKLKELGEKVEAVTKERDALLKEVEELKRRERQLRELLLSKHNIML